MKLLGFTLGVLLLTSQLAFAGKDSKAEAEALISAFKAKTDIQAEPYVPFRLSARVLFTINKLARGTYVLYWSAPDRWREEVVLNDYREITVRNGNHKWVDRSSTLPAYPVSGLRDLIGLVKRPYPDPIKRIDEVHERKEQEITLVCVGVVTGPVITNGEDCFDKSNGLLMSSTKDSNGRELSRRYSNYEPFDQTQFPREFHLMEGKEQLTEAHVESLSRVTDESKYGPLEGVEPILMCDDMQAPTLIEGVGPQFSERAMHSGRQGYVSIRVLLGSDGGIRSASVDKPLGDGLDEKALEAVKKWKFRPAQCGPTPVPAEIDVEISFRRYGPVLH